MTNANDLTTPALSAIGIKATRSSKAIGRHGDHVLHFVYLERGEHAVTFAATKADMFEALDTKRKIVTRLPVGNENIPIYRAHVSILEDAIAAGFCP